MNASKAILSFVIMAMMLVLPIAAIPVQARPFGGPSVLFWAERPVAGASNPDTYEYWVVVAYRSSGPSYVSAQSQLDAYMVVYEVVSYSEEPYSYNGTAIMWGTLSSGVPEVFAVPNLPQMSLGPSALAGIPTPAQPADGGTFYGDPTARTSGAGALVVRPDGIVHNGDPEERATIALNGYQANTQSSAVVAGTFACASGPNVFNAALYFQITGQVYSFSYSENDGSSYQLTATGQYQTHKLILTGNTYFDRGYFYQMIGAWGVYGDAYPNSTNMEIEYLLYYGLPWAIPED